MAILRRSRNALCLVALVIMATCTVLSSANGPPGTINCMPPTGSCDPAHCTKFCAPNYHGHCAVGGIGAPSCCCYNPTSASVGVAHPAAPSHA
ncbi:hypothetical protein CFC21_069745 [Triticum aestivum]|uniref:Uncharacterized protein n=2 Tax=Triticum aestivum TaxID=4565 RepID=A0A3B6UBZ6_WHEAT|nr:hypothetical protein CFC21_069745 [Triticum aestivum]